MLEEIKFDNKRNRQIPRDRLLDKSLLSEPGENKKRINLNTSLSNLFEFEQLSEKAVELIFNNKINAKNAFDVNVDYLDKLPHLLKKNEETSWQKASASLDASAKIYGYRVDSVHSETFKFLGGLSRAETKDEIVDEHKKDKREKIRHDGYSTLEKDIKKLDLVKYDLEFEVDPLFKSMTVKFAESGARGLILKNLPLDSNLDVLLESKNNIETYKNFKKNSNEIKEELKFIIEDTLNSFTLSDIRSLQICPDLSYFKKSRNLETSLEKTFYKDLMQEFDETVLQENMLNDRTNISESLNNSINFVDNYENDNLSSYSQRTSSLESGKNAEIEEGMNLNNFLNYKQDVNKNSGMSYICEISSFKNDVFREHIQNFGDGSKEILKNMPNFRNFTKSFNQLEKLNNNLNYITSLNNKEKKNKKEEILFEFSVAQEIHKYEIFDKDSKVKKNVAKDNNKKENKKKKKVRGLYYYERNILHNLFTISDKFIYESNLLPADINNNIIETNDGMSEYHDHPEQPLEEEKIESNNFPKFDNEYDKKFGRLYKTFDVREIKNKIWESFSNFNKNLKNNKVDANSLLAPIGVEKIDFKQIIGSVSNNFSKDVLNNISTPTCFVCLLHLSNEKNLILQQLDDDNFTIMAENL